MIPRSIALAYKATDLARMARRKLIPSPFVFRLPSLSTFFFVRGKPHTHIFESLERAPLVYITSKQTDLLSNFIHEKKWAGWGPWESKREMQMAHVFYMNHFLPSSFSLPKSSTSRLFCVSMFVIVSTICAFLLLLRRD